MRKEQVDLLYGLSKFRVRALLIAQTILLLLWLNASIVPGFANVMSEEAGFNAITHIGFWTVIEVLTIVVGSMAKSRPTIIFFIAMLLVAVTANVVHIVASLFELSRCTSLLCMGHQEFLVALIGLLALQSLLEIVQIYYANRFLRYLKLKIN